MIDLTTGVIVFDTNLESANPAELNQEQQIDMYEQLLAKSFIMRAIARDDTVIHNAQQRVFPYIKNTLDWLRNTDFYTSPASTKYHDARYGGLLYHTLQAYYQLLGLRSVPKFKSVVDGHWWSAVFAILVHDWCKIGRYTSYLKNEMDDETGEWRKVPAFKYVEDAVTRFGHGTQSLIMAMQICNAPLVSLTFEEMAAIRWHMDAWDIGHYDESDLAKCNERIPMVRMVQFADQLAITIY